MSLPLAFNTTLPTIPAIIPYLGTDENKKDKWKQRLGNKKLPRIGLAWSGSATNKKRTIPLQQLEPLLRLPVEFHALQKEISTEDAITLNELDHVYLHHDELIDFSDTAALISELDLVISIDTAAAHLAGALGQPVWILLPFAPDFRWLTDREDSPWYPTARLFRQVAIDDWNSVITDVVDNLKQYSHTLNKNLTGENR
jgi:ADP-heptose:LPS heptosyltransferase